MRRSRTWTVLSLATLALVCTGCSGGGRWGIFTFGHNEAGSTVASDAVGYNMAKQSNRRAVSVVQDDSLTR